MKTILGIAALLVLCGCATHNGGSHVLTGTARPAIVPEAVRFYAEPPTKYDIVGLVSASAYGDSAKRRELALMDMKKHAAQMGANGIILEATTFRDAWSSESLAGAPVCFSGKAIFVNQQQ